jgi:hypothetical protein
MALEQHPKDELGWHQWERSRHLRELGSDDAAAAERQLEQLILMEVAEVHATWRQRWPMVVVGERFFDDQGWGGLSLMRFALGPAATYQGDLHPQRAAVDPAELERMVRRSMEELADAGALPARPA